MCSEYEVPVGRRFLKLDIRRALYSCVFFFGFFCAMLFFPWFGRFPFWSSLVYIPGFYLLSPALKQDTALKTGSMGL